jgi:hypothetical protein
LGWLMGIWSVRRPGHETDPAAGIPPRRRCPAPSLTAARVLAAVLIRVSGTARRPSAIRQEGMTRAGRLW